MRGSSVLTGAPESGFQLDAVQIFSVRAEPPSTSLRAGFTSVRPERSGAKSKDARDRLRRDSGGVEARRRTGAFDFPFDPSTGSGLRVRSGRTGQEHPDRVTVLRASETGYDKAATSKAGSGNDGRTVQRVRA
jgi:hypothetical protein